MGLYIKGMRMPENCGLCDLFHAESPMHCTVVKGHKTVGAPYGMPRPDWCPLVEVKHGKWIPVSERLPEKSDKYYVSGGDKVWICEFLIIPNFTGGWCNDASNPVVQAWMPLPKPYEVEE